MKKGILLLIGVVVLVLAVSACTDTTDRISADDSATVATPSQEDVINEAIAANPEFAHGFCDNYFTLIDQGWNNETIYSELDAAGTFDDFPVDSHDAFHARVKWCYHNG